MTDAIGSDRESLLRAIDPRPARRRLATRLCRTRQYALPRKLEGQPGASGEPYQLVGTVYTQTPFVLTESVLAIDPQVGWARICDEWIVLGTRLTGATPVDPADIQRVGASWLIRQLIGLSVH